jgi:hypothetical protein
MVVKLTEGSKVKGFGTMKGSECKCNLGSVLEVWSA